MKPHNQNLAVTIGKNTLFSVLSSAANTGTRLLTVPIVIGYLGIGGYGIWSIIMTTAAYMRFGSVGVKSAFQKYVAEATGDGNYERANKLLSTGFAGMLVFSVAVLIPLTFFSRRIAVAAGVPPEFLKSAAAAISVLALIMVVANAGAAYEAIVMGGHRIDLARRFNTFFTIAEAVAIIVVLHLGYSLFTMALIMGMSEVGFIACCYFASRRILPQIRISSQFLTKTVIYELVRFAGSYQLVNILEVAYNAVLPFAILRAFGAEAAGLYALSVRVAMSSLLLTDAFLVPILSGGTMAYASGSTDTMQRLVKKAFKVTLGFSLAPLAFISLFGTTLVFAWTGVAVPAIRIAIYLVCVTGLFKAFSMLGLVLYRVSGHAVLDNVRQVLRLVVIFLVGIFAHQLGFYGVLAGLAAAELVGMVFMLFALTKTFHEFRAKSLLPDSVKLVIATALILAAGVVASHLPIPPGFNARMSATFKLGAASLGCLFAAWPVLLVTKSVTTSEGRALLGVFLPKRMRAAELTTQEEVR